ncbi:bifunctional 3-(3-hydroxy-phenyl)propionate/3-hydroxycinnamic acid hydroxylase [Glutamicibacter uratoxydans]|uniref:bifunctional 3-(3-hydroxy-phenyl)propionate/3-hydroxycinnamic acid hydroxylase n=1 Tax=Glutamicibacter uratoxydans TaxID=43667 RepID=UPI003D6F6703
MTHQAVPVEPLTCDVAVVGLGPVGGLVANLLAATGLKVVAVDSEPDIMQLPRGVGIDGEIMRAMQTLGLAEELEPFLKVFRGAQYLDAEGQVVATRPPANTAGTQGWPDRYNVHQPELEAVLRKSLRDRHVVTELTNTTVEALSQDDQGVTLTARNTLSEEALQIRAKYTVGSDGGKSTIRRLIDSNYTDYGLNQPWIVADFAVTDKADIPDINTHYAHPQSPAIYIHVVRNIRRFEFRALPDEDLSRAIDPQNIWQRVSRWITEDQATLLRAAVYTHRSLVADRWRKGRVLLAGDAAHQTPPFLGQGLCTGVRDATNLVWRLRDVILRDAPDSLLDSYGTERSAHAEHFIKTATELGTKLTKPTKDSIDLLNSRVGREGRGTPPRLGPGIFDPQHGGGVLSSQPRTVDGVLMDELLGYEFGLVMGQQGASQLLETDKQHLESANVQLVPADVSLDDWLAENNATAILIRPDRYIYGIYEDLAQCTRALQELAGNYARDVSVVK